MSFNDGGSFATKSIQTLVKKAEQDKKSGFAAGDGAAYPTVAGGGNAAEIQSLKERVAALSGTAPGAGFATLQDIQDARQLAEQNALAASQAADAAAASAQAVIDAAQDAAAQAEEAQDQAQEAQTDSEQAAQDQALADETAARTAQNNTLAQTIGQVNQTLSDRITLLENSPGQFTTADSDFNSYPTQALFFGPGFVLTDQGGGDVQIGLAVNAGAAVFQAVFDATDWTGTGPRSFTVPAGVHALPYTQGEVYAVTVTDDQGCSQIIQYQTNLATGDVIVTTEGPAFDGIIRIQ